MRAALLLWAAALATPPSHAQPTEPSRPATLLGDWWTPGFNARVRIEACGDAVCGHIVWACRQQLWRRVDMSRCPPVERDQGSI